MIHAIAIYLILGCCLGIADELAARTGGHGATFRENAEHAAHTVVCWPYVLWQRIGR